MQRGIKMSRNLLLVSGFLLVASWGLVAAAMGICLYHDYDKSSFWVDYFGPKWIIVTNCSITLTLMLYLFSRWET